MAKNNKHFLAITFHQFLTNFSFFLSFFKIRQSHKRANIHKNLPIFSRYDEWIRKERVAENLTTNKTNKKSKTPSKMSSSASGTPKVVRKKPPPSNLKDDASCSPRSTTPNSGRNKSPATAQRRKTRAQPSTR